MGGFVGAAPLLERMLDDELARAGLAPALDDERALRAMCMPAPGRDTGDLDAAAAWLSSAPVDRIWQVIQILTMRFHLRNKSEQLEIASINRQREYVATTDTPRAESIAEAVQSLARSGASPQDLTRTLARLDIQPTLTAHPTEARRRAVLRKQQRIAEGVQRLDDPRLLDAEREAEDTAIRRTLLELAMTDEVRAERLDAMDEVRNGLHFLVGSIWRVVPELYSDLRRAIHAHYPGAPPDVPTILRYRSWIGGDRDGNPRVTPDITRQALRLQRKAAIEQYLDAITRLRQALSISTRRRPPSPELLKSIAANPPLDDEAMRHLRLEPYRVFLEQITLKLRQSIDSPAAYTARDFEHDLLTIRNSLETTGLDRVASAGPIDDLLIRVRTFGLHLAALDIRQHSDTHEAAVSELLRVAGVTDRYASLPEIQRLDLLRAELASPRPLSPARAPLSGPTRQVLDTLSVVTDALDAAPGSVGSYIVSMTHQVSDVLETLLLAKEAGLFRPAGPAGEAHSALDIAPLFETIDDLRRAEPLLRALFDEPIYRAHLHRRHGLQEVMLGYSDSNKDGGYWVANWLLHRAQGEVSRASQDAGVCLRLFHGRGGTIGRGGGRANRAILAAPRDSRTGRIRFTEQGEVISFRYALPAIAHRHLEQIISAMIVATHSTRHDTPDAPEDAAHIMETVSRESMNAYRSLIDDDDFWNWYTSTTPIAHISRLPLASRPVMRSPGAADFSRLRAIPWVFAWTQIRATVPGWFGVGAALASAIQTHDGLLPCLREWNDSWEFFRAVIANAEQELARARLQIAERYAAAAGHAPDDRILARVRGEYERTVSLILSISGSERLLDRRPVIRDLIRARNPDTDVLNLCQIELMNRARAADGDDPNLEAALLASVNAIAAAMQSTG